LRFGHEPEGRTLELSGNGPGAPFTLAPLTLTAQLETPELPAYGRLPLDILGGDAILSIRGDEAEEAWRVLTPVLDGWANDLVPLGEYAGGSGGPSRGQAV
jgi:glucose-6-phosphate 1-dehydrogenase